MDHPHFWFVSCFGVNEEEYNRILRNSLFDPPRGAIFGHFRYPKWKFQFFRSRGHSSLWIIPIFGLWVVLGSMRRKTTGFCKTRFLTPPRGRKMAIFSIKNKNFIFCSRDGSSKVVVLTVNFKGPFHKKIRSCILFYQKCHIVITSLHTEGFAGPRSLWLSITLRESCSPILICGTNSHLIVTGRLLVISNWCQYGKE